MKPALFVYLACVAESAAMVGIAPAADARPPLADPVVLNIGLNCQWQPRCMKAQTKAMKHALKFVRKSAPPVWKVELCNHNAGRGGSRVDWVGFDHCLGNPSLAPLPPPPKPRAAHAKRKHRTR